MNWGKGWESFVGMTKEDAHKAAYRLAAKQISDGIKAGIVSMMKSNDSTSEHIESISAMLDSEFGSAFISYILGTALTYAPKELSEDPRAKRLAEEFRINGIATAGNAVIDAFAEQFLSTISTSIKSLPEETSESQTTENVMVEVETEQPKLQNKL